MITAYKKFWINYANFNGRSTEKDYWDALGLNVIVPFALVYLGAFTVGRLLEPSDVESVTLERFFLSLSPALLYIIVSIVPFFASTVRRLHDINITGWLCLLIFIPPIGLIALLIILHAPSVNKNNRYGPIV